MHHMKTGLASSLVILGCVLPTAFAQNLGFLSRAPIAQMSEVDQDMFSAAFNEALDDTPVGGVVEWRNPETDAGGTITVLDTHKDYGTICRTLRTVTQAGGRDSAGTYRLCVAEDQTWQFAPLRKKREPVE